MLESEIRELREQEYIKLQDLLSKILRRAWELKDRELIETADLAVAQLQGYGLLPYPCESDSRSA